MRKLILVFSAFAGLTSAQILGSILRPTAPHYLDVVGGNDSNNGLTPATAWATGAHADAVLPVNAPMRVKFLNGSWYDAPRYWHTMKAWFPFVPTATTDTTVRDMWGGLSCTIVQGITTWSQPDGSASPSVPPVGLSFMPNGGTVAYADCGAGALGGGTGDMTIAMSLLSNYASTGDYYAAVSNGAIYPNIGWGIQQKAGTFLAAFRSSSTAVVYCSGTPATAANHPHTVIGTLTRNSATGVQVYIDGTQVGTCGEGSHSSTAIGSATITNSTAHTLIGGSWVSGAIGSALAMNRVSEIRVYGSALASADAAFASAEMRRRANHWGAGLGFGRQLYLFMGSHGNSETGADNTMYERASRTGNDDFEDWTWNTSYDQNGLIEYGNPIIAVLNPLKALGVIPSYAGEVNCIQSVTVAETTTTNGPDQIAVSSDCRNWTRVAILSPGNNWSGVAWWLEDGYQTDISKIHLMTFDPGFPGYTTPTSLWEQHPTVANFSAWTAPVLLHSFTQRQWPGTEFYNMAFWQRGATWYMFYSNNSDRYMRVGTCTAGRDCLTKDDTVANTMWTEDTRTGDWAALGTQSESYCVTPSTTGDGGIDLWYYPFNLLGGYKKVHVNGDPTLAASYGTPLLLTSLPYYSGCPALAKW